MFISVLARRLKPGKTYEDFVRAWYPDKGFGVPMRGPYIARNMQDEQEILAVGFIDIESADDLMTGLAQVAERESVRHDRIDDVIESTELRGIYEVVREFDFSSDESVAADRPDNRPVVHDRHKVT